MIRRLEGMRTDSAPSGTLGRSTFSAVAGRGRTRMTAGICGWAMASDVQSVDETVAVAPRQADGTLPVWPFLRPVAGGRLIDKGVNIGEPYAGAAPDLGAFEDGL